MIEPTGISRGIGGILEGLIIGGVGFAPSEVRDQPCKRHSGRNTDL